MEVSIIEERKKEKKCFRCHNCNTIVTSEGEPGQKIRVKCPNSGKEGTIVFKVEKKGKIEKLKSHFLIKQPHTHSNIIGIILVIIGFVFLFNPTYLNLKISFTMIFIGCLLIFMISETSIPKRISDSQIKRNIDSIKKIGLLRSEKITLIIIIWTLFLFFITSGTDIELFFICIFLGILVIKELTDKFTTVHLKKRMNIFIFVFLIAYIIIIVQHIFSIFSF